MVIYKKCSEVEFSKVYEGFQIGFSDYMVKLEMTQDVFEKRFFGPEGNDLEYSYIASDGENPVGVVFGGIKNYEGVMTLRCGALCIHPQYRGAGVSKRLFELHRQVGLEKGCKQLFLEVIVGNERAIKFYENLGYSKIYDIKYFTLKDTTKLKEQSEDSHGVVEVQYKDIKRLSKSIQDVHINWQNDFDFMEKLEGLIHYGIYENSELLSAMSISPNGKIFFIWTDYNYRHRGFAKSLITRGVRDLNIAKISISLPNNASIEGFIKHLGFEKDAISQYEMYLTL